MPIRPKPDAPRTTGARGIPDIPVGRGIVPFTAIVRVTCRANCNGITAVFDARTEKLLFFCRRLANNLSKKFRRLY
jgi:hypothetical protein